MRLIGRDPQIQLLTLHRKTMTWLLKTFLPAENVICSEKVLFLSSMPWALFWAEVLGLLAPVQQSSCSGSDASTALPYLSWEYVLKQHTAADTPVDNKASCYWLPTCFSSELHWKWGSITWRWRGEWYLHLHLLEYGKSFTAEQFTY